MKISNCVIEDLNAIFDLYQDARKLQTERQMVVWPFFEDEMLEKEIENGQQWKMVIDGKIVCNWAIAFTDKEIWEDKEKGDAIYIHRIATHPDFRGNNFVSEVVTWAKVYAANHNRKFVRLDTLGNNTRLIGHYTKSGFTFLGKFLLSNTEGLPKHYQREPNCCLFEIEL